MNKSGQVWAFSIMLGLTIIILALALAPAGQSVIEDSMNASTADMIGLDCNNSTIGDFQKGTCTILDFSTFYFFGGLILIGGAVVTAKIAFGS